MPIITPVEAKSTKIKVLYGLIYAVLTIGAISMVYPMLMMLAGSVKSDTDIADMEAIPGFFYNDEIFYRKFLEAKYNGETTQLKWACHKTYRSWRTIPVPTEFEDEALLDLYNDFTDKDWPAHWQYLGHMSIQGTRLIQFNRRHFLKTLEGHYSGSIEAFNREMNTALDSWIRVNPPMETELGSRRYWPSDLPTELVYREFKLSRPKHHRYFVDLDGYFIHNYLIPTYGEAPDLDYQDPCQSYYNPDRPDRKNYNQINADKTKAPNPNKRAPRHHLLHNQEDQKSGWHQSCHILEEWYPGS